MNADEDDFIELAPRNKYQPTDCPITFTTISLRGGVQKVSLSFIPDALAKLEGWPRFTMAWSPKTMTMRLRASTSGGFEAYKVQRGQRYILRADLPPELCHVPGAKTPAAHVFSEDGKTVFIVAPLVFHRLSSWKPENTSAIAVAPAAASRKMTHAEIVEAARRAVPAPKFGSR